MDKTADGQWRKIPSYRLSWPILNEATRARITKVVPVKTTQDGRLFLRTTEVQGEGFEYAIFHNVPEKKCVCLFQPGPLLQGLPGIIHGGALVTMIDTTCFMTAYFSANAIFTGTLTISFKSPLSVGSLARLEAKVTGTEGKKVFLSCDVQSSDKSTLYAEASAIFF